MSELQQPIIDHVLIHATCVAIDGKGILLLGKSGSGKSDLALRLCDQNGHGIASVAKMASLVADDQVILRLVESKVMASAPASIAGKLEIRGLGIVLMPYLSEVQIKLIACLSNLIDIERLPAPEAYRYELLGEQFPRVIIDPTSASAPARLRAAVDWFLDH